MNLHRASQQPEWELVPASRRTRIQRIAAGTRGVITPANIITALGLGIVLWGVVVLLREQYIAGMLLVALGRLLDVVDGLVAEATHTKSPLGEVLDAAVDKIGTLLTVGCLFVIGVTHWWVILLLILPQVLITLLVFYKNKRRIRIHPTRPGKLSMVLVWVAVAGILLMTVTEVAVLEIVTYSTVAVSCVLGLYALWQYATGRQQD